jgi:hypothetical protein
MFRMYHITLFYITIWIPEKNIPFFAWGAVIPHSNLRMNGGNMYGIMYGNMYGGGSRVALIYGKLALA